ncbi:biopolymer transporter ExbD [Robiginitalea sp. M366]|uniref:ExbD/TolR family protein n=1 Tax=Robiginitalea aestuariiviva TaxID=3036903 RepID=UPI00240E2D59|nr:biopolymer transporter ExbD [Robiginitalea aestuariiviva]MDG1571056.1 biopolymer transporter ExbD [Robiginitalea aestuariiviva]
MLKIPVSHSSRVPAVSTAALPDIVFMLLFFFMTVTTVKEQSLKIENTLPVATEIKKLERRDLVIDIHVGAPLSPYAETFGNEPQIQLNGKFARVSDVGPYILEKRASVPEHLRALITISLKVDQKARMGLVQDIKEVLREVHALKVNYTTYSAERPQSTP